jgi:hypothetical protein
VKWEHKKFRFLDEQAAATSALRTAMPQQPLSPDLVSRIKVELAASSSASTCAQLVEQSIAFILATGSGATLGEEAGATLLSDYIKRVLLLQERLPLKSAESEVRLWHLDAFLKLLQEAMELDPMEGVATKYRASLEPAASAALRQMAALMDLPVLLPAMQSFAAEHLREEYLNSDESMKAILAMVATEAGGDMGDLDWFQHFPADGLAMGHWVATFQLLASL